MSRAPIEFELKSADGEVVQYSVVLHPPSEAQPIIWQIMHAAAKPLASLLEGNLGRLFTAFTSDQEVNIQDLITELDLKLSTSVEDIFGIIHAIGPEKFTRSLLTHTYRNGLSLKQTTNFDNAYIGNYGEMLEACFYVIKVNRFLGVLSTFTAKLVSVEERVPSKTNSQEQLAQRA